LGLADVIEAEPENMAFGKTMVRVKAIFFPGTIRRYTDGHGNCAS